MGGPPPMRLTTFDLPLMARKRSLAQKRRMAETDLSGTERTAAASDQMGLDRRRRVKSARPVVAPCRNCSRPQIVSVKRIELAYGGAWHRCRNCGELSPIRWADAVELGLATGHNHARRDLTG